MDLNLLMPQNQPAKSPASELEDRASGWSQDTYRLDLAAVGTVLKAGWLQAAMIALGTFAVVTVFAFTKPDVYTASARFLPPSGGSSMGAVASQLSLLTGSSAILPQKTSGDTYIGILSGRTIADKLIARFHLLDYYKVRKLSVAEAILAANSKFELGVRDGILTVKVTDRSPQLARELANAYLDELHEQSEELAITEASQRRLFFEQQLQKEKDKLADAEVALREVQEKTGAIAPTGRTQVQVQTIAQTRAAISSREAALAGLRASSTDQNRAVIRLQHEIAELQRQLGTLPVGAATSEAVQSKVPQTELEYVRRERDVKYHEGLFDALSRQYESARLDESQDAPLLQVLDHAVVPDTKSGPPRMLILCVGFVLGILMGVTYTLIRDRQWMQRSDT